MKPEYLQSPDAFVIRAYNQARPFSSFLPGIAGEAGKPMWVFYANRGQCIASFGIRNKNSAMLEFYPANKAYTMTPITGFRTFLRLGRSVRSTVYEPFRMVPETGVEQLLRIRPQEIEIVETHRPLGLRVRVVVFNVPNEELPVLLRMVEVENLSRRPIDISFVDGLPQVVPFGLGETLLKQMSRTMEAFAEVRHIEQQLPYFKLKVEPSDRPEVEWVEGGFFSFSLMGGRSLKVLTDPEGVFGQDTSFSVPQTFAAGQSNAWLPRTESLTPAAFATGRFTLPASGRQMFHSYFGQADRWELAAAFRQKVQKELSYAATKRQECGDLLRRLTDTFAVHSGLAPLDAYSRQAFLDNTLRGGRPFVAFGNSGASTVFHYYSRKHGDMERDYNFFEVSPTYFSQGNGNFRDVNQNRRSEVLLFPGIGAANIETFFNLLQLDGFNPLVIQYERFSVKKEHLPELLPVLEHKKPGAWGTFLSRPFSPGSLFERLIEATGSAERARPLVEKILSCAHKVQDASHGEGFWIDHWTYNLDLLENFEAVYPDQLKSLMIDRKDFTYFENDHVVQPRARKTVRRADGAVRQMHAVVKDAEKARRIRGRAHDAHKVRTRHGEGEIYQTSLLSKILGLLAVKACSLDPFGVGLEMESEKPGWCDALNGLPGLFGSSVNEAFELRRWVRWTQDGLREWMSQTDKLAVAREIAELLQEARERLAGARPGDEFFKSWDALHNALEKFRETTRLGVSGEEVALPRADIEAFLNAAAEILDAGLGTASSRGGLCATYFINEMTDHQELPEAPGSPGDDRPPTFVQARRFRQIPVTPFLEGPVHALRAASTPAIARRVYQAVRASALYDRKLKMYRLNAPLLNESFEIGRNKIFTPGWLENESIFLHMHYKFLLETLRSGLADEFFKDLRHGLVAFQDPAVYGRSTYENSSFIASSRFPDKRIHGTGFVARLTGATAEWISIVLHMGLGLRPFRWENNELRFEPKPVLAKALFSRKATAEFERDTFGFKLLGRTWVVYHNPFRRDTFGTRAVHPVRFALRYQDGQEAIVEGRSLPESMARDLRDGKLTRLSIRLG